MGPQEGVADPGSVLKTLLISDLVDSTRLVERLGDARAFEVFGRHDRLARDLLPSFSGREIDKTDGFLLLFDRPIDAACYALAYHEALARLGAEVGVGLAARCGIHLGEVFLRENLPEDVARGAKPLEVEGLAKPIAARLMSLATGTQTLLTRAAFDVARRAAVGHEQLVEGIEWLAHGAYLLKGVEEPVEVFEVGRSGFAPLEPPPDSPKAARALGDTTILGWRPAPDQSVPHRPNWTLERKLGEGGFGEVWLAHHRKTRAAQVFKFCFEAERLKSLQREVTLFRILKESLGNRSDIARILDWSFEEPPYFLECEYTEGGSLADWAAQQGGISRIGEAVRLEIVAKVADALSAAHSVGVLHKDVKPANILIALGRDDEPRPLLTDFGIGQVTSREQAAVAGITLAGLTEVAGEEESTTGTQLYMAPELLEGRPATLQADIYALGVVLFQIIVGDFRRALAPGWEREIADELLREDIAALVDGSPEHRLADAAELARRLRRLDARRTEREAARRQREEAEQTKISLDRARRRQKLVAAATVVLLLVAGSEAWHARRLAREKARAEREAETARQVADFLVGIFRVTEPTEARGNTVTARELLDRGAARVEKELSGAPLVLARLQVTMGHAYASLGLYPKARELAQHSLELRERELGPEAVEVAESLEGLARAEVELGRAAQAESLLRRALTIRRSRRGENDASGYATMSSLASVLAGAGRLAEAETTCRAAAAGLESLQGKDSPQLAKSLGTLGQLAKAQGRFPEAEQALQRSLAILTATLGLDSPDTAQAFNRLAALYADTNRPAEAEAMARRCLQVQEQALGPDHPDLAPTLTNLAAVYSQIGQQTEAERLYRRALGIAERTLGAEHPQTVVEMTNLADVLRAEGRLTEAGALLARAVVAGERSLGSRHPTVGAIWLNRGEVLAADGQSSAAEECFKKAEAIFSASFSGSHPWTAMALQDLGTTVLRMGRRAEAEELLARARTMCEATLGAAHPQCVATRRDLAGALRAAGKADEAARLEAAGQGGSTP